MVCDCILEDLGFTDENVVDNLSSILRLPLSEWNLVKNDSSKEVKPKHLQGDSQLVLAIQKLAIDDSFAVYVRNTNLATIISHRVAIQKAEEELNVKVCDITEHMKAMKLSENVKGIALSLVDEILGKRKLSYLFYSMKKTHHPMEVDEKDEPTKQKPNKFC